MNQMLPPLRRTRRLESFYDFPASVGSGMSLRVMIWPSQTFIASRSDCRRKLRETNEVGGADARRPGSVRRRTRSRLSPQPKPPPQIAALPALRSSVTTQMLSLEPSAHLDEAGARARRFA